MFVFPFSLLVLSVSMTYFSFHWHFAMLSHTAQFYERFPLKNNNNKKKKTFFFFFFTFLKLVVMKTIQHKACIRRQTPISLKCSIDVVLSSFTVHWLGFSNLRNSTDLLSLSLTSTCTFQVMYTIDSQSLLNIGIKHGFSCINIRQVLREVLKTEAGGRGF